MKLSESNYFFGRGSNGKPRHRMMASIISAGFLLALLLTLPACSMGNHGSSGHHGVHDDAGEHHEGVAGQPGVAADVTRTIQIDMSDAMDYTPASLTVMQGETIRFSVTNNGQLTHEFVLGSEEEIMEHHELMKRFPGMEHDEPNSVSLEPGGMGEVIWTFSNAGEVDFACLQPGHFEAGMRGKVAVEAT